MRLMFVVAAVAALSGGAVAQNAMVPVSPAPTLPSQGPTATPSPTPSSAPPQRFGNRGAMMQACQADFANLCPGMTPGDGKLGSCIRANRAKLSSTCQAAMRDGLGARRGQPVPPAATPTP